MHFFDIVLDFGSLFSRYPSYQRPIYGGGGYPGGGFYSGGSYPGSFGGAGGGGYYPGANGLGTNFLGKWRTFSSVKIILLLLFPEKKSLFSGGGGGQGQGGFGGYNGYGGYGGFGGKLKVFAKKKKLISQNYALASL